MDLDDLYIEYYDLVESGEINSSEISIEDWVVDRYSELIDKAHDYHTED